MYTHPLAYLVLELDAPLSAIIEAAACTSDGVDDERCVIVDDLGNIEWRPAGIDGAYAEKVSVSREHADLIRGFVGAAA